MEEGRKGEREKNKVVVGKWGQKDIRTSKYSEELKHKSGSRDKDSDWRERNKKRRTRITFLPPKKLSTTPLLTSALIWSVCLSVVRNLFGKTQVQFLNRELKLGKGSEEKVC